MPLSAPIHQLKRRAKLASRQEGVPLHKALDRIAATEGFASWSLLIARHASAPSARDLFTRLTPGDLMLIGARPRQGKTLMGLALTDEAAKAGRRGMFFTLEETERSIGDMLGRLGIDPARHGGRFGLDTSDDIDADHIAHALEGAPRGSLAMIDYLQLLDRPRSKPDLTMQVTALKRLATERGLIIGLLSQIDRTYDPAVKRLPDLGDVRLAGPLDLSLFSRSCFLHEGAVAFH